jgi:hypothetical protein
MRPGQAEPTRAASIRHQARQSRVEAIVELQTESGAFIVCTFVPLGPSHLD